MTDDDGWSEVRAKHEAIDTHPGTVARRRWDSLQRVHKVVLANEAELLAWVDQFESNEDFAIEVMRNIGQTGTKDVFFDELFRRMHNYLSAVKMLVDHTRNLVRSYPGAVFVDEYRERIAGIATRGLGPFLQKLRDYLVHYRIPPFGTAMHFDQENPPVFTVYLDRDAALEFDDWPSAARIFLQSQPAQVLLGPLVREYATELETLYSWLYEQFQQLHSADIQAVNELIVSFQGAANTPGHPDYRPFELRLDEQAPQE